LGHPTLNTITFPFRTPLGGKTVIENAGLVHSTCHPRGPVQMKAAADQG